MVSKGDKYTCEDCGIILAVDDPCGCTVCDLICCGVPMKRVKVAKKKKKSVKGRKLRITSA